MEKISFTAVIGDQPLRPPDPSLISSNTSSVGTSYDDSESKTSHSHTESTVDDDVLDTGIDGKSSTKAPRDEPHLSRSNQVKPGEPPSQTAPESGAQTFKYQRLDPVRKEIRLLHIKNLIPDGVIECFLTHASLMEQPAYKALSYCWGDEYPKKKIRLNGFQVDIRPNLYSAMWHIASNGHNILWVDALCINQDDLGERADQIQHMKYIYHKAQEVFAWLGDADENTTAAVTLIAKLATRTVGIGSNVLSKEVLHLIFETSMNPNDWRPLEALFQRQYWSRVWIIQELAVAKHCWIISGTSATTWEFLSSAVSTCREYLDACERSKLNQPLGPPPYPPPGAVGYGGNLQPSHPASIAWSGAESTAPREQGKQRTRDHDTLVNAKPTLVYLRRILGQCDSIMGLDRFRADFVSGTPIDFIEALMRSSKSRASDIRDKAISLLGLAHNGFDFIPLPNYTQSPDELSIEITAALMKKQNSLRFLSYFWERRHPNQTALPSWSVDWLNLHSYHFLDQNLRILLASEEQKNIYFRGNTIIQRYLVNRTKPKFVVSGRTLQLRGKCIGTILDVSKTSTELLEEAAHVRVQESSQNSTSAIDDALSENSYSSDPDQDDVRSVSSASFHSAKSEQLDHDVLGCMEGLPQPSPISPETGKSSKSPHMSTLIDSNASKPRETGVEVKEEEDTDSSPSDESEADENPYLDFTEATKALLQTFTIYADLPLKEQIDSLTEYQYTTSTARIDLRELVTHNSAIWLKELDNFLFQDMSFGGWMADPQYLYLNKKKENTSGLFTRKIRVGGAWEPPVDYSINFRIREELQKILDRGVRLLSTAQGYVGWGHAKAKIGDQIWLLSGSPVPIILRSVEDGYVMVGDVYIYGVLDGRATEALIEEDLDTIKIF